LFDIFGRNSIVLFVNRFVILLLFLIVVCFLVSGLDFSQTFNRHPPVKETQRGILGFLSFANGLVLVGSTVGPVSPNARLDHAKIEGPHHVTKRNEFFHVGFFPDNFLHKFGLVGNQNGQSVVRPTNELVQTQFRLQCRQTKESIYLNWHCCLFCYIQSSIGLCFSLQTDFVEARNNKNVVVICKIFLVACNGNIVVVVVVVACEKFWCRGRGRG